MIPMPDTSLGAIIVLIVFFGSISNFLNWRYLNYGIVRFLYYIGAFVHETSHAVFCVLTGARIEEFTVFSDQPHVIHQQSKLPFLGDALISFAPIVGGLLFLFLVNRYLLGSYFAVSGFSGLHDWHSVLNQPLLLLSQINLLRWQSWIMILLFLNVGAMLGPSMQDLKNVWPMLVILFFISSPFLTGIGFSVVGLILINIALQVVAIVLFKIVDLVVQ
jgi:hypothetical protein